MADTLCGHPRVYNQGVWFNSAKFFDIEYQVYGYAPAQATPAVANLYWQHPTENKSIRLCYMAKGGRILGFVLISFGLLLLLLIVNGFFSGLLK